MTYLGEGTWINSCLVGANSYKVLSSEETYRSSPLEERTDDWPRLDEQHYAVVASNWITISCGWFSTPCRGRMFPNWRR